MSAKFSNFLADRLAATKNKNYEIFNLYLMLIMDYQWVWSRQSASTNFLLKGWEATPRNFAPAKISHYTVAIVTYVVYMCFPLYFFFKCMSSCAPEK